MFYLTKLSCNLWLKKWIWLTKLQIYLEGVYMIAHRATWNIFISVFVQFLITWYNRKSWYMILSACVISLRSCWQKRNFISGDKISCKLYPKWNHMRGTSAYAFIEISNHFERLFHWLGNFTTANLGIPNHFKNLFHSYGDFTAATFQTIVIFYCTCANDNF